MFPSYPVPVGDVLRQLRHPRADLSQTDRPETPEIDADVQGLPVAWQVAVAVPVEVERPAAPPRHGT